MLNLTKELNIGDNIEYIQRRIGDCCPKIDFMGKCPDHKNPATIYVLEVKSITKIEDIKEAHTK